VRKTLLIALCSSVLASWLAIMSISPNDNASDDGESPSLWLQPLSNHLLLKHLYYIEIDGWFAIGLKQNDF